MDDEAVQNFELRVLVEPSLARKMADDRVFLLVFFEFRVPGDGCVGTRNSELGTQNSKLILYQGALNAGRGLESAILAMKSIDFAELWLAGEGDLSQILRKMVAENGLENRVKFLGFVRPVDLPALTKQAWVGINLLEKNGLSYYYSLANKFFDYIQNGVPSLNMAFPEYQKINEKHEVSLLLKDCTAESIAEALVLLKNNKNLYQKLVENSAEAAQIFNWENEEAVLIDLYKKLLTN